jgi:aryl-alcohol dehydrogenase-like predicted oxidoreductase
MKYNYLGSTGIRVSSLCMGTMTFGREADKAASKDIFHQCRDAGINFFDCANVYSQGRAERILGGLIADCRHEVVITSKFGGAFGDDPNNKGGSRRNLVSSLEASLKRLDTDYLDIYFLHHFDPQTPLEETLRGMDDAAAQGKIRYAGVSNFAAWQIAKALGLCALNRWAPIHCIQPMYNLVKRQAEVEILPLAQSEKLAVVSYNPLGGGLLTGKYGRDRRAAQGRLTGDDMYMKRYGNQWMYEAAVNFAQLAGENGFHPVTLAVAWAAHHPAVTAPIIGARSVEQVKDSLQAAEIELNPELYEAVCRLTPRPVPATDRTEILEEDGKA